MATVDEIKKALDIVDLIDDTVKLTHAGGDTWKGAINPGSNSGKSLNVDRSLQLWHDWPSDTGGTVLDWIAYINNLDIKKDFRQVLQIAADKGGLTIDTDSKYETNNELNVILNACFNWYHDRLTDEHRDLIHAKWGITNATIDQLKIGYAPNSIDGVELYRALYEVFDKDLIHSTGLFIHNAKGWQDFYRNRIVFPYWNNGNVVYSAARTLDPNIEDKYKYLKHITANKDYVSKEIVNVIYGVDSVKDTDSCLITEGITDAIMAGQAGIPCISPVTTNFSKKDIQSLFNIVKDLDCVYICNDNEESGQGAKGAMASADTLRTLGINVKLIDLPRPEGASKIDLAEYLRDNSIEDFYELIETAIPHTRYTNPDSYFDDKDKFVPKALGDDILSEYNILTLEDTRQLLLYECGVFANNADDKIKKICMEKLGHKFKPYHVNEAVEYIRLNTLTDRDELNTNTYLVNVKNGMVDVFKNRLIPHSPKYKSTVQLDVTFDKTATCEAVNKFLYEVTSPDNVPLLFQYIGYCLTPDISQHKALVLDGNTGNGKSVFIEMVLSLIGKKNYSVQSIQHLNNNRFATSALDGKMLNVFTDLPSEKLRDNSTFKMVTGDKVINAEIKGGRCYEFKNTTHHIYSANQLPDLENLDEMAFFRRLINVQFDKTFQPDEIDKHLIDKLTTEEEKSGLLNIALLGLSFLIEYEEFCINPSIEVIQNSYLVKSNPVKFFLDTCTDTSLNYVTKKELYDTYLKWCEISKPTTILKDNAFGRHMKGLGFRDGRETGTERPRVWYDIELSNECETWLNILHKEACPGFKTSSPGYTHAQKRTWSEIKEVIAVDSMSSCPCSHVILYFYKIYNKMYSSNSIIPKNWLDLKKTWTTRTEHKNPYQEPSKEAAHASNTPDISMDNPDRTKEDLDKDRILIRVLQDIPSFTGVDKITYNLKQGDIVTLPTTNAKPLIKRHVAFEITPGVPA